MLLLVDADRDEIRLIEQDVRRHEDRIGEQTDVDVVLVLRALVLELRHAVHLPHVGVAVEDPGELRVRGNVGLEIENALIRVNAARDVEDQQRARSFAQHGGILADRDRVLVDDAVKALVFILQIRPVLQCAEIVAQREVAGRLHSRKDNFFSIQHSILLLPIPPHRAGFILLF